MALVTCKECGNHVASSAKTCPKCGVDYPAGAGRLLLARPFAITGAMHSVTVAVNGEATGAIKNGGSLVLDLVVGDHRVKITGGGMSDSAVVTIKNGEDVRYELAFSALGILGGGLKLRPS